MNEPEARPVRGDELWMAIPPGWIELVAHADDVEAARWFDRLLDKTPDLFDDDGKNVLRASYDEVRRRMPREALQSAGVLVTAYGEEATLWQYTVSIESVPTAGDINFMAVVERFMASEEGRAPLNEETDFVENYQTVDGRDGIAIHTTTAVDNDAAIKENMPLAETNRLGVVYAAVRLNRPIESDEDKILLVTGVSPNLDQRLAMSIIAAQITLSARLHDNDAPAMDGRVDVDATGRRRDESIVEASEGYT